METDAIWIDQRLATFCRIVARAIADVLELRDGNGVLVSICRSYVDDILYASVSLEHHVQHLKMILDALETASLSVSASKCHWAQSSVCFLGHFLSAKGMEVDPARISRIRHWKPPTNRKSLLSFLGFVNFCRQFIPGLASICAPLYGLLKKHTPFNWSLVHRQGLC